MISSNTTFRGYRRENGRVGVRNHVIILPVDDLSNAAAQAVEHNIKGTLALPHPYGRLQFGADLDLHFRTLIGTGSNPNRDGLPPCSRYNFFATATNASFFDVSICSALTPASAEVLLTAHSFVTDAGSFGAESCGVDRCVQVLAQVDGGAFLTTSTFVVNLSTRAVLSIS